MSYGQTSYIAKTVDANGYAEYTAEENAIWHELITRQHKIVQARACDEFLKGLELLNLPHDRVPQLPDVSKVLQATTGWALEPVPALIPFNRFFELLANRRFPAATFIRIREELDYVKEPDIFHEIFGHAPLLTNPAYADFAQLYGTLGLKATPQERVLLARLFWFTIEFGLIETPAGLRAYGGGILSSYSETEYCLENNVPHRKPFDIMNALRTPYRIDEIQPIYFVINNFDQLYHVIDTDLIKLIHEARESGDHPPAHVC